MDGRLLFREPDGERMMTRGAPLALALMASTLLTAPALAQTTPVADQSRDAFFLITEQP